MSIDWNMAFVNIFIAAGVVTIIMGLIALFTKPEKGGRKPGRGRR